MTGPSQGLSSLKKINIKATASIEGLSLMGSADGGPESAEWGNHSLGKGVVRTLHPAMLQISCVSSSHFVSEMPKDIHRVFYRYDCAYLVSSMLIYLEGGSKWDA